MKNIYTQFVNLKLTGKFFLVFVVLAGFSTVSSGQIIKPFTQRTSSYSPSKKIYNIKGDYTMIGNTNLTLNTYGDNTNNSNNTMVYVDIDGVAGTLNSSSANLTFSTENGANPTCSNIIYAGLYWTGRAHDGTSANTFTVTKNSVTKTFNKQVVSLKGPGASSYTDITANASDIYYPTTTDGYMYSAYAEVTDYVKTHGIGDYTVADIALREGNGGGTGYYGGWGLVVVYENSKMNWRDVTLFDGHAYVQGSTTTSYELPISGFNTVQAGNVNMKLGMMAGEGDIGISGDYFQIINQSNAWVSLNHSGNTTTNFFNGSIQTGGGVRYPNLKNNTGLDIAMFNIPNINNTIITNNQTSTRFKYGSTQDTYIIFCIAMAVDAYIPYPEGLNTVQSINNLPPGSPLLIIHPGDDMVIKVELRNKGAEAINNTKIVIPVPYTASYVNSSKSIYYTPVPSPNNLYFDPSLGANGSVVWDLGTLPKSIDINTLLADLSITFKATTDCEILTNTMCSPKININGTLSGKGAISGTEFSDVNFISGHKASGSCIGEPITEPISINFDAAQYVAENCQGTPPIRSFTYCNVGTTIPITDVNGYFPAGSRFFDTYPVNSSTVEYTISNPFPATTGTITYFAVPPGDDDCYSQFTITVNNINTAPSVNNIIYCQDETATPLVATPSNPDYILYYYTTATGGTPQTGITPSTATADSTTYYVAEGPSGQCISPNRVPIIVTVKPKPTCSITGAEGPLCTLTSLTYTGEAGMSSYSWEISGNGSISGISTSQSVNVISGNIENSSFTIILNVTNSSGCTSNCTKNVIVLDNTPPVVPVLIDVTGECNATATVPNTIDDCSGLNVIGTTSDALTYNTQGTHVIHWTFSDSNGNSTTANQNVIVKDITAPVIPILADVTGQCSATATIPFTTDICSGTITGTTTDALTYTTQGTHIITWSFDDGNGNITTAAQNVIIKDVTEPVAPVLADMTGECSATATVPTTTDDCTGQVITGTTSDALTYNTQGTHVIHWSFDDGNGNISTANQNVVIKDITKPVFAALPAPTIVYCPATPEFDLAQVTDNCGNNFTLVFNDASNPGECRGSYSTTRTWIATDAGGNTSTASQTINVQDTTAPVLSPVPADTTVDCNSLANLSSELVVNGNFSNAIPPFAFSNGYVYQPDIAGNLELYPEGRFAVGPDALAYHNDFFGTGHGGTGDNFLIVNGFPGATQPIVWKETITDLQLGTTYYFSAWARSLNDAGNYANLKFSINGSQIGVPTGPLPAGPANNLSPVNWIRFYGNWTANSTTAVLSIVDLSTAAAGNDFGIDDISFGITVTATDACDNAPVVTFTEARTDGNCSNNYTLTRTWTAKDACGNESSKSQVIKVMDVTAPVIAALPEPSTIQCPATPVFAVASVSDGCDANPSLLYTDVKTDGDCAGSYSVTRTWTAKDACGNTSAASQTINVQDITAPVIAALPAPTTIDCPAVPEFATAIATDDCGSAFTLTFDDVKTDGDCAGSYSVTRTWTAKDACGNTSTASQTINVQDITAPVIAALPAPTTIDCPAVPEFATAIATDDCGSAFTLTFDDIKTDGDCAGSYSVTRTWTAKDACGNTSTASQTINVQDITAPVIAALPAPTTIDCPAVPEFASATATDDCGSAFTLTFDDVKTDGDCAGSYSVTRTWTAKDACGNTSTASQTINVQDITAPVIAALPAPTTIDCPAVPEFSTATATDDCGSAFTLTFDDVKTDGDCAGSYSVTRTWTAKDACGNTSTASQTINVEDITAPVIAALPAPTTIDCPVVPEFATPTATDDCGSSFTLTFIDVKTDTKREGTCPGSYSITRTWTAKDACGNTSTASQTITVQDVKAPILSEAPANVTVECNAVPVAATLTATDNCDAAPIVTFTEVRTNGNCPNNYTLTRAWTATDACLNTSTASQIVTVQNVSTPVLTCPANIAINNDPGVCGATITVPKPSVTVNCGSYSLSNSVNQTADASGLYPIGTTTVEWTVSDECGNTSKCSMTVTVTDNEKPVIACPSEITICSGEQVVLGTATATDNCGITGITNNAPTTFEPGTTLVVWTATDNHGNSSSCTQAVTITPKVTANAGPDAPLCSGLPYTISGATAANFASVSWTHNGHGSLSNVNILNPVYTPSAGESGAIEFTLTAKGTSGCGSVEVTDKFILTISPAIAVNAGADKTIVSGTATSLAGTVTGGSGVFSYTWTPAEYLVTNTSLTPNTLPLNSETVFMLTAIDAISGCSASDEVKISVDDVVRPIARDDYALTDFTHSLTVDVMTNDSDPIGLGLTISITAAPKAGTATLNENGSITYTNSANYTGKDIYDTLTYTICDKGSPSKCASARLIITIIKERLAFEIYNLLTPNGDGQNDFWHIDGIEEYPENEIILFNRWGDKVNEFKGYSNASNHWNGNNEKGNLLPSGTYFYIIKLNDEAATPDSYTGWVLLRGNEE